MYNTDLPNREDLPTTAQLLRSTLIALGVAGALLITVILPAEYGVDPTRIGRLLGLTQMGEIKMQLSEEAARDELADQNTVAALDTVSVSDRKEIDPTTAKMTEERVTADETADAPQTPEPEWTDEVTLSLAPGEAAEIKLIMTASAVADYEWTVDQGHLNSDLHGDGVAGQSTSYRRGRAKTGDAGALSAQFDGSHGWFWRNRSNVTVSLTLRTRGNYSEVKRIEL